MPLLRPRQPSWPILSHHVPKEGVRMHIIDVHIHQLSFHLQPVSREENKLILTVSAYSLVVLLWVGPLHQNLQQHISLPNQESGSVFWEIF